MTQRNLPDVPGEGRYRHGGDLRRLAERAGCAPEELLDFSASLNPLGPPAWLGAEMGRAVRDVAAYPDPSSSELVLAACEHYKVWPGQILAGNGASELLLEVARLPGVAQAVIPVPAYVDYERVARLAGLEVRFVPMDEADGFRLDMRRLTRALDQPSVVFLGHPNNPTGVGVQASELSELAVSQPDCRFVVDESFADFAPGLERFVRTRPDNVFVVLSMTKFWSVPGLRLGLLFAAQEQIMRVGKGLPAWSVNAVAQRVGTRCLRDLAFAARSRTEVKRLRDELSVALGFLPGLKVHPSEANFLLCRVDRIGGSAEPLVERLLAERIAIRPCADFQGLDERYFRVAVRGPGENARLVRAMERAFGVAKASATVRTRARRKPAIMLQGTSSNAGKSVLAAALCRIFLQDGLKVAPFKAQNMSNNSFVTREGGEMGRAQVTQAMACRLDPDVRMNPVLLKPGSDTGSQVVVMGRAVGNMDVAEYVSFKPRAFEAVQRAYDDLSSDVDVMVLEGAGSPAEINLKHHDIVNMAMADYADACVLLVGDIDRGGVFAALAGTMDLLEPSERDRVLGYVLNRFRGDPRLLDDGLSAIYGRTGKPVLGVVPYIPHLGLPEEDSVSFKSGEFANRSSGRPVRDANDFVDFIEVEPEGRDTVDVVCLDLNHISNFNDLDPLLQEPDVRLRVVDSPFDLGAPDCVILPGSKATVRDMRALKGAGMAAALRGLSRDTTIVGICGGFQMLGREIDDPHGLETDQARVEGFGLLPVRTSMALDKTLTRVTAEHLPSGLLVHGYEIHHGRTVPLDGSAVMVLRDTDGQGGPLGYAEPEGRVWGTYIHGIFDDDQFRRWFLDRLRERKGLRPLGAVQTIFGLEPALDNLASVVREHLDMDAIYRALGFTGSTRPSLLRA